MLVLPYSIEARADHMPGHLEVLYQRNVLGSFKRGKIFPTLKEGRPTEGNAQPLAAICFCLGMSGKDVLLTAQAVL